MYVFTCPKFLDFRTKYVLFQGLNMEASVGHLYTSTTEIDVVVKHLNPQLSTSDR